MKNQASKGQYHGDLARICDTLKKPIVTFTKKKKKPKNNGPFPVQTPLFNETITGVIQLTRTSDNSKLL